MIALYAGSFHPPTLGHLDIIQRSAALFERVYVAVMINSQKHPLIPADERARMLKLITRDISNVEIVTGETLTAELAKSLGAGVLVRGVRGASDLESEMCQAHINRRLTGVDTLFLPARLEHMYTSSTIASELARYSAPIDEIVPASIKHDVISFLEGKVKGV